MTKIIKIFTSNKLYTKIVYFVIFLYLFAFFLAIFSPDAASEKLLAAMSCFGLALGCIESFKDSRKFVLIIILGFIIIFSLLFLIANTRLPLALGTSATVCGFILSLLTSTSAKTSTP